MATIRQKGSEQGHAQVRRTGWPPVTEALRTRKDAETWTRDVELQMDRGVFVDRSAMARRAEARALVVAGQIFRTSIERWSLCFR
jgi:hypothetical protein